MTSRTIEPRAEALELRVDQLEQLPARIDALTVGVSELRVEMRSGFSAVRNEFAAVRSEFSATIGERTGQLRADLMGEIQNFRHEVDGRFVELKTQMLVLHEEVLDRISRIGEGRRSRKRR